MCLPHTSTYRNSRDVSESRERSDTLFRQNLFFFFYNFEECEILLSEFDRGMELVVVVVVFLRVSRASRS